MSKRLKLKKRVSEAFDLPEEIILDTPIIKIVSNNEVTIENHKGIVEYTPETLRMNSILGIIKIIGRSIQISEIDESDIIIRGEICSLEFMGKVIK